MTHTPPAPTQAAWLRSFWCDLCFPGTPTGETSPLPRLHLLAVVLLPALLLYTSLGFRLLEPDESRYAQIPAEMIASGDYVVPTLQGEPYLDKPPLFYWAVMASYRAFGVSDAAARFVPAVCLHLTLIVLYLFGRRTLGERPAFFATMLLLVAPGFVGMSRLLILDGMLMLFVSLALFAGYEAVRGERLSRPWWLLTCVACGLGVLCKGPVAVILVAPPLFLAARLGSVKVRPSLAAWLFLACTVAVMFCPWLVALCARRPEFARYFFWEHNVQRFLSPGMHARGTWFFGPVLFAVLFPGSLLLWPVWRFLTANDAETRSARPPALGYHLLAGSWCVVFFTLSSCKLPTYILPGVPALALVAGAAVARLKCPRLLTASASLSYALTLFVLVAALPWYAGYRSPMSKPREVLAMCADKNASVVCYPRNCDSVAFYLGRSDLRSYRSKEIEDLRTLVRMQPRTVILCTHRHSLAGLKELLPPEVAVTREVRMGLADIPGVPRDVMRVLAKVMGETALGLADLAVVEKRDALSMQAKGHGATAGSAPPSEPHPEAPPTP